jgi:hypothetical protein
MDGFLLGSAHGGGEKLNELNVAAAVVDRYRPQFVHWCFAENSQAR